MKSTLGREHDDVAVALAQGTVVVVHAQRIEASAMRVQLYASELYGPCATTIGRFAISWYSSP